MVWGAGMVQTEDGSTVRMSAGDVVYALRENDIGMERTRTHR